MHTAGSVIVAALFLLHGLSACVPDSDSGPSGDAAPGQVGDGTARMARRLEEIAENFDPAAHPYVNNLRVQHFSDRLAALRESVVPMDPRGKSAILKARFDLANELLLDGQSEAAIEEFEKLRSEIKGRKLRHRLQALLGLAHLRLGEQDNCIVNHTVESCLFPISGNGVHRIQRGSRTAAAHFEGVLSRNPDDLAARWMLNIAYMTLGEYPESVPESQLLPPELFESDYDIGRFRDVAPALGLDVVGLSGGAIMEDFDRDGHLDIMAASWGLLDQLRYFRNAGDGSFADLTDSTGLTGVTGGLNTKQADFDNDGYRDVLVLRGAWLNRPPATDGGRHPNSLLKNFGGSRFDDVTEAAGLLTFHPTQTAAWGDYDNDGWLDLYIGNETFAEERHPCELFHNGQDGTFRDRAATTGLQIVGYVKAVVWGDYDNDGQLDLYASRLNPDETNLLYRNEGAGDRAARQFADVTDQAGVHGPPRSFPGWFWDYDDDGWLDIFVSGYEAGAGDVAADYLGLKTDAERPRLYRNNGDGTFADVTAEARIDKVLLTMGSNYGDLDNDSYPDCYIGTGDPGLTSIMPNRMFRNAGGEYFQDVTSSGGFGHLQKGHGVAFGDLDHDGDQDVFAVMGGAFTGDVYQNVLFENPGHGNHWLKLELEGVQSNRDAIGARIQLQVRTAAGARTIHARVSGGGSFGASSMRREIGLGAATTVDVLEIFWPASGTKQRFENVAAGQLLRIREGEATYSTHSFPAFELGAAATGAGHSGHGG